MSPAEEAVRAVLGPMTSEARCREVVRAVLMAVREPSEGMVAAGIAQTLICTDDWTASAACVAEHLWPKMIDALLSEEGPVGER